MNYLIVSRKKKKIFFLSFCSLMTDYQKKSITVIGKGHEKNWVNVAR